VRFLVLMLFRASREFERVRFMILNLFVYSDGAPGAPRRGSDQDENLEQQLKHQVCHNRTCAWPTAGASQASQKRTRKGSPGSAGAVHPLQKRDRRSGNPSAEATPAGAEEFRRSEGTCVAPMTAGARIAGGSGLHLIRDLGFFLPFFTHLGDFRASKKDTST